MRTDQTTFTPHAEPLLALDGVGPLRDQLARAVRAAVRDGRLAAGSALPASRTLADTLGVSRWVVTEAYGELVAEGVLEARTGSATRVGSGAWAGPTRGAQTSTAAAARHGDGPAQGASGAAGTAAGTAVAARSRTGARTASGAASAAASAAVSTAASTAASIGRTVWAGTSGGLPTGTGGGSTDRVGRPATRARYDLGPGVADLRHVPRQAWARAARDAVMTATPSDLLDADTRGASAVRAVLAARLRTSRAVVAEPDDVVVTHGSSDGVARVARALVAHGHRALLVEDPGWPVLRDLARNAGLTPVPVPVDADGVDTDALAAAARRSGARAVLVTPAHQFPSGGVLAPARRDALVRWARSVDGLVLEDDYDAEFRYDRRPVAALQGLAPDRVVLVGSVSKTLAPAFGIGWLVGPRWLVGDAVPAGPGRFVTSDGGPGLDPSVPPPPVLHQLAFAALVADGSYDRHLRAARTRYRRRRTALLDALAVHLPGLAVTGVAAGLHAVLTLPDGVDEGRVVRLADRRHVHVVPAGRYQVVPDGRPPALVLGYGNLVDAMLPEAVRRLADAVRAAGDPTGDPAGGPAGERIR